VVAEIVVEIELVPRVGCKKLNPGVVVTSDDLGVIFGRLVI
jgi:hypothetical protein